MAYKETFWMACDSTEQLRAEYGPFHTRTEAEVEAKKLGFGYLLRYEHLLGANRERDIGSAGGDFKPGTAHGGGSAGASILDVDDRDSGNARMLQQDLPAHTLLTG